MVWPITGKSILSTLVGWVNGWGACYPRANGKPKDPSALLGMTGKKCPWSLNLEALGESERFRDSQGAC